MRVVDEGETSALATTILGAEAEDGDLVRVGLVELGQLLAKLGLGDVGTVRVEDIPVKQQFVRKFLSYTLFSLSSNDIQTNVYPTAARFIPLDPMPPPLVLFRSILSRLFHLFPLTASTRKQKPQEKKEQSECLHDHLLPAQERVAEELARPQGNGSVGHDCS